MNLNHALLLLAAHDASSRSNAASDSSPASQDVLQQLRGYLLSSLQILDSLDAALESSLSDSPSASGEDEATSPETPAVTTFDDDWDDM